LPSALAGGSKIVLKYGFSQNLASILAKAVSVLNQCYPSAKADGNEIKIIVKFSEHFTLNQAIN